MKFGTTQAFRFHRGRVLPVILQTEAAECGLACIAMVSKYYGHHVDLAGLRRKFQMSLKGTTLKRIIDISNKLKLETYPLRIELNQLRHLKTPCILHWDMNHFVVLKSATSKSICIHDPAQGERSLSIGDASKHFTGVALEVIQAVDFTPIKAKQKITLRGLTGDIKGLKRGLTQIMLLAICLEMFSLAIPFYMQWILDQVLPSMDWNLLTLLGAGFILVVIIQSVISVFRNWLILWLGNALNVQWVSNLFSHLIRLPLDYFEKRHLGDVESRFGSTRAIQRTLTTSFIGAILDGLMASLTTIVLLLYSVKLTIVVIASLMLYAILRWMNYKHLRRANEEQIVFAARQQSELLESVRGVQTITLANKQNERRARYRNAAIETVNRTVTRDGIEVVFKSLSSMIFGVENILVIWIASIFVLENRFTAGMLVAFAAYTVQFTARAGALIDKWVELGMAGLHAERIADIALTEPEQDSVAVYSGPEPEPSIEVKGVSFRYADDESWVLKDCNFRINAGESVAIVGPSGCGKTTLAKLILGLLKPSEGNIFIGGIDIRKYGLYAYRGLTAAVMQDDRLFAGSLAENISFFDFDATTEKIQDAATAASIHDDIAAMPMGYESLVGDMGSSLSGGQRQRVILARALYREPKILILDEATSHLDIERERRVNQVIDRLKITRIVIAHRPETIAGIDHVISLESETSGHAKLRSKINV